MSSLCFFVRLRYVLSRTMSFVRLHSRILFWTLTRSEWSKEPHANNEMTISKQDWNCRIVLLAQFNSSEIRGMKKKNTPSPSHMTQFHFIPLCQILCSSLSSLIFPWTSPRFLFHSPSVPLIKYPQYNGVTIWESQSRDTLLSPPKNPSAVFSLCRESARHQTGMSDVSFSAMFSACFLPFPPPPYPFQNYYNVTTEMPPQARLASSRENNCSWGRDKEQKDDEPRLRTW